MATMARRTENEAIKGPPHEQLVRWRKRKGLSQAGAAKAVGVSQPTWRAWERGESLPSAVHALRLHEVTKVRVASWREAVRIQPTAAE